MTPWDTLPDRGLAADMDRLQRAASSPENFRRTYAEVVGKWGPERVSGAINFAATPPPSGQQTLPSATRSAIAPAPQPAAPPPMQGSTATTQVSPFPVQRLGVQPPLPAPRPTPAPSFGGNMVPPSAMPNTPPQAMGQMAFRGNQGAASGAPATSFWDDPWGWLQAGNRQWALRNAGNRFLSPNLPAGGQYPTGGLL